MNHKFVIICNYLLFYESNYRLLIDFPFLIPQTKQFGLTQQQRCQYYKHHNHIIVLFLYYILLCFYCHVQSYKIYNNNSEHINLKCRKQLKLSNDSNHTTITIRETYSTYIKRYWKIKGRKEKQQTAAVLISAIFIPKKIKEKITFNECYLFI